MSFEVIGLDHVQLAMPAGGEEVAESFYRGLLGFARVPKPEPMATRGGCWFVAGTAAVHLGVEADFRPARKAFGCSPMATTTCLYRWAWWF